MSAHQYVRVSTSVEKSRRGPGVRPGEQAGGELHDAVAGLKAEALDGASRHGEPPRLREPDRHPPRQRPRHGVLSLRGRPHPGGYRSSPDGGIQLT